jgi:hypothetical protein
MRRERRKRTEHVLNAVTRGGDAHRVDFRPSFKEMKVKSACCATSVGGRLGAGAGDDESKRRPWAGGLPRDLLA